MNRFKNAWNSYTNQVKSPFTKMAQSGITKTGKWAIGTVPGGMATFGTVGAIMSYDSSKRDPMSHAAQEAVSIGSDTIWDTALWSMGPWGAGASILGMATGITPSNLINPFLKHASDQYRKQRGMGEGPITQNERTMRATRQGLSLLGQSSGRGHSLLGQEAGFMHN